MRRRLIRHDDGTILWNKWNVKSKIVDEQRLKKRETSAIKIVRRADLRQARKRTFTYVDMYLRYDTISHLPTVLLPQRLEHHAVLKAL